MHLLRSNPLIFIGALLAIGTALGTFYYLIFNILREPDASLPIKVIVSLSALSLALFFAGVCWTLFS